MDAVVVQDHVDLLRPPVVLIQLPQQFHEQPTHLLLPFDPMDHPRPRVQRPRQVALAVLPRRQHLFLLAVAHPVVANLGVQVDIHLVLVQRHLVPGEFLHQSADLVQASGLLALGPRAVHLGTRPAPACADATQRPAEGGHVHLGLAQLQQRCHEQLTRPGRARPAVVLGGATHQPI